MEMILLDSNPTQNNVGELIVHFDHLDVGNTLTQLVVVVAPTFL